MALRLNGSSSGYVELDVPAAAGSHTLTLPNSGGSSGQYLQTNGSGGLSWQTVTSTNTFGFTSLGETATTSGSGSTVSGIPSSATEVIIILTDISCSNTTTPHLLLQMGNGSVDTGNNYRWTVEYGGSNNQTLGGQPHIRLTHTAFDSANNVYNGIIRIIFGASNIQGTSHLLPHNNYQCRATFTYTGATTIDRVSISSASTFDAGKYEVLHNGQP